MYLKENPIFYANSIGYFKQYSLTKAVGAAQKFVDTGVSAEYVLDRNIHNVVANVIVTGKMGIRRYTTYEQLSKANHW